MLNYIHSQYDIFEFNDVGMRVESTQCLDFTQIIHLVNTTIWYVYRRRKKHLAPLTVHVRYVCSVNLRVIFLFHLLAGVEFSIQVTLTLEHLRECAFPHLPHHSVI